MENRDSDSNPNSLMGQHQTAQDDVSSTDQSPSAPPARTASTDLDQQEQEGSFFIRLKDVSSDPEVVDVVIDQDAYDDDEECERALRYAEVNKKVVEMMASAGIFQWEEGEPLHYNPHSQITWQDVDPDDMTYEELIALGEAIGTQRKGLSEATISSLPLLKYNAQEIQHENKQQFRCVICCTNYKEGDELRVLPCKHNYHVNCINKCLRRKKVCPVCKAEVSEPKAT